MSIDSDLVSRIGDLAKIELSKKDVTMFSKQLSEIVDLMNQLEEVDTSEVPDLDTYPVMGHENRPEDIARDGDCIDLILKNAPEHKEGFFTVKKVIE